MEQTLHFSFTSIVYSILAVAIGCGYFYHVTRDRIYTLLNFLLGCLLTSSGGYYACHPGAWILPVTSAALLITLHAVKKPTILNSSLAVIAVIALIACKAVSVGLPKDDIHVLWGRLAASCLQTPHQWTPGVVCIFLAIILPHFKQRLNAFWAFLPCWAFCLCFAYSYIENDRFFYPLLGMGSPIGLSLLIAWPVFKQFSTQTSMPTRREVYSLWLCAAFLIIASFGYVGFVERIETCYIIPFTGAILMISHIPSLVRFYKSLVAITLVCFGSMELLNLIFTTS